MALKSVIRGLLPAFVAVAVLAGAGDALAQSRAKAPAGDKVTRITKLGNPGTRVTPPMKDVAALKKTFSVKRNQQAISRILDRAGLTSITPQVMEAITTGSVEAASIAPNTTMQWMGLRRGGKPEIVSNVVWAGKKAFDGFQFVVDDMDKTYTFVVPKACGNLALISAEPSRKKAALDAAKAAEEARKRAEQDAAAKAAAEAKKKADEAARLEAERKAFEELSPACGVTATPAKVKGGYDIAIDGTGATAGRKPAQSMTVQIIGPTGQPVPVTFEGTSQTELTLKTPFKGTVFVKKPKAGTYTLRVTTVAGAAKNTCEATATVPEDERLSYFVEGDFGKERRMRVDEERTTSTTAPIVRGFCAPLVGFQGGVNYMLNDNWAITPAVGFAINTDDGGQSSLFADVAFNYFTANKAYVGTGFGIWDFNHSDTVTGSWLVNFGFPVWEGAKSNRLYLSAQWRFLLDGMDDVDNNYQFWGGLRYVWR